MNTIQALQRLHRETKAEVFLVGGFVRDYARNKGNPDLDVVVRKLTLKAIMKFLGRFGSLKEVTLSNTNEDFDVNVLLFKARGCDMEAQISLPRRGKKQIADWRNTLEQDVRRRDFKINCLYLPVIYKSKKHIIDLVGGLEDIRERKISSNGSPMERFRESPIRMMRAISLAARTDYTIDAGIMEAIPKCAHLIEKVPFEAIQAEFKKILLSKKPSKYMRLLNKTGLLKHIAPEIARCVGVKQDKRFHKYDVFTHVIYSADHAPMDLKVRLAALLHDIGKAPTYREVKTEEGVRITFHKHEMESVKMARDFLRRMKFDNELIKEVLLLVKMHMFHYTREWTDSAIRKFIKSSGITEEYLTPEKIGTFPLFQLRIAERLGSGFKSIPVTDRQKDFEARILEVYNAGRAMEIKDLAVTGHDIMEVFKIPQGKTVGDILRFLLENVLENQELNERMPLLKLATEYVAELSSGGGLMQHQKDLECVFPGSVGAE
jgi:tRNA nucleotidyltransferase (CCA-adding enzyme)